MSDIDPNAAEKLLGSAVKILNKRAQQLPAVRKMIEAMKELGEDTTEMEQQVDAVEALMKNVAKTAKSFPAIK